MTQIQIKNTQTGEFKLINNGESFRPPWAFVSVIAHKTERETKLAIWATKLGLPLPAFLDAARWLLDKDCPFCEVGVRVLRQIEDIGEDKATTYLKMILDAKERGDHGALAEIRKSLWSSDQPALPQRS